MSPAQIAQATAVGRSYAYYIIAGTRVPHSRHYPNLAALVGVELPGTFSAALSMSAIIYRTNPIVRPTALVPRHSADSGQA